MILSRRKFFGGLALAAVAPAIIRTPGLLMPIKPMRPIMDIDRIMEIHYRMANPPIMTTEESDGLMFGRITFGAVPTEGDSLTLNGHKYVFRTPAFSLAPGAVNLA